MKNVRIIYLLSILLPSCFDETAFDNIEYSGIIEIDSISTSTVLADGIQGVTVYGHISDETAFENRSVVFRTTHGFFARSGVDTVVRQADDSFIITATLRAKSTDNAQVTAEAKSILSNASETIIFEKAYPHTISVSVDSVSISNSFDDFLTIKASLGRVNGGVPTKGHKVSFSVVDSDMNDTGFFLNGVNISQTDENGQASIIFTAGNTLLTEDNELTILVESIGKTTNDESDSSITNSSNVYLDIDN